MGWITAYSVGIATGRNAGSYNEDGRITRAVKKWWKRRRGRYGNYSYKKYGGKKAYYKKYSSRYNKYW